jgi:hypothetical protein
VSTVKTALDDAGASPTAQPHEVSRLESAHAVFSFLV